MALLLRLAVPAYGLRLGVSPEEVAPWSALGQPV